MTEIQPEIRFSMIVTLGPKRDRTVTMNVDRLDRLPIVCRACLAGCTESEPLGIEVQARTLPTRGQLELTISGEMAEKLNKEGRSPACEAMARWPSSLDPVL